MTAEELFYSKAEKLIDSKTDKILNFITDKFKDFINKSKIELKTAFIEYTKKIISKIQRYKNHIIQKSTTFFV